MSKYLKRLHFAPAKTRYISFQTELRFCSRGYEQPPYQGARGMTNSKQLTGNRPSSSDNDLRLGRQDSCSNGFRANAAAEKPSPTKDENQPFKPKRRRSGVRAALAVSSAKTTSSGCHHLSTDGHLLTNAAPAYSVRSESAPVGPRSRPCHKNENGTIPEHERCPRGVRRVGRPPNSRRRSKDR
jgi:hypothetical protein